MDILRAIAARGVRLSVVSGSLLWRAPAGALTAEMKLELTMHKVELLDILLCGEGGADPGTFSCWLCWAPWEPDHTICQFCTAIAPGLSEVEMDAIIYGKGKMFVPEFNNPANSPDVFGEESDSCHVCEGDEFHINPAGSRVCIKCHPQISI